MVKRKPIGQRIIDLEKVLKEMVRNATEKDVVVTVYEIYNPKTGEAAYTYQYSDGPMPPEATKWLCSANRPYVGRNKSGFFIEAREILFSAEDGLEVLYIAQDDENGRFDIMIGEIDGMVRLIYRSPHDPLIDKPVYDKCHFRECLKSIARNVNCQFGGRLVENRFASEKMKEFGHLFD